MYYHFQQQQLGGTVLQYEEGAEETGDGGEGVGDGRHDCEETGDDVQGSGIAGVALWVKELGSDGCDAEGAGGVPTYI